MRIVIKCALSHTPCAIQVTDETCLLGEACGRTPRCVEKRDCQVGPFALLKLTSSPRFEQDEILKAAIVSARTGS